jgi:hypothetical protein
MPAMTIPSGNSVTPIRRRTFVRASKAWYAASALSTSQVELITAGFEPGDTRGHVEFAWAKQDSLPTATIREDAYATEAGMRDLFDVIARASGPGEAIAEPGTRSALSPDAFCEVLAQLGFVDETEFERPAPAAAAPGRPRP